MLDRIRWTLGIAPVLSFSLASACTSPPLVVQEPKVADADEQQATCKVAKDPLNPMIIEWPGTSKVDFDVRSQTGLVAVSYAGCTLKVLPRCNIGGKYTLRTVTPTRDRFEMSTATDLYARLPLGAAALKGELAQGAALELDYVAVGQRVAEGEPTPGTGPCEGATHYIQTITVGAYSLDAKANGAAGAGIDVAGAGIGAKRSEAVKHVRGSGSVDECMAKPDAPSCLAVIQVGLATLPPAATSGAVAGTPTVPCPPGETSQAGRCVPTGSGTPAAAGSATVAAGSATPTASSVPAASAGPAQPAPGPQPARAAAGTPAPLVRPGTRVKIPGGTFEMGPTDG